MLIGNITLYNFLLINYIEFRNCYLLLENSMKLTRSKFWWLRTLSHSVDLWVFYNGVLKSKRDMYFTKRGKSFSTLCAGSSISHTLGKKRVLKIELPTRRIKKLCTIHVRKRDSRLVCLSTLASLGCKHHTRRKSTFPHLYRNVLVCNI